MPSIVPLKFTVKNIENVADVIKNREKIFKAAKKVYTSDRNILNDAALDFQQLSKKYTLMGVPYSGNTVQKTDGGTIYYSYNNGEIVSRLKVNSAGDVYDLSTKNHYMILNKKDGLYENTKSCVQDGIPGVYRDVTSAVNGKKTSAFYVKG